MHSCRYAALFVALASRIASGCVVLNAPENQTLPPVLHADLIALATSLGVQPDTAIESFQASEPGTATWFARIHGVPSRHPDGELRVRSLMCSYSTSWHCDESMAVSYIEFDGRRIALRGDPLEPANGLGPKEATQLLGMVQSLIGSLPAVTGQQPLSQTDINDIYAVSRDGFSITFELSRGKCGQRLQFERRSEAPHGVDLVFVSRTF